MVTHDSMSGLPLGEEGGGGHFHCITLPLRMMSLFLKLPHLTLKDTILHSMWNLGMKPISRHETSKIVLDDISNIIRICLIKLLLVSVHTFGKFKHFV